MNRVIEAHTFTERCRRMLTEQPNQHEFTLSRGGLETLVLDSERYAEQNRLAVTEHLANEAHREKWRYKSFEEQLGELRRSYPDASIGDPDEYGQRLLTVPGVKLPKGWDRKKTTIYVIIPSGFPSAQPLRFYTSKDLSLDHGGSPKNTAMGGGGLTGGKLTDGLLWWHWRIIHESSRHSLVQYVNAMRCRFSIIE